MKKGAPGCLGCIGDEISYPINFGDFFISQYKDPYKNQPVFHGKYLMFFFCVAHMVLPSTGGENHWIRLRKDERLWHPQLASVGGTILEGIIL